MRGFSLCGRGGLRLDCDSIGRRWEVGRVSFITASYASAHASTHEHLPPRPMAIAVRGIASSECRTCAQILDGVHIYRQAVGKWYTQHLAEPALGLPPSAFPSNCRPHQHIHTRPPASDLSRALVRQILATLHGHAISARGPTKTVSGLDRAPGIEHCSNQPTAVIVKARLAVRRTKRSPKKTTVSIRFQTFDRL